MRFASDVLTEDTDTSAFVGDAISNAVLNPNPMLNQLEINMNRHSTDPNITQALKEKQLFELQGGQLPFS